MAKKTKAVIDASAYNYGVFKVRGKDGAVHYSRGNGDAVHRATLLHIAAGGTLKQLIEANKLEVSGKSSANEGQLRMTIGTALRGKVRNGETVKIGKHRVDKLTQKDPVLPKFEAKTSSKPAAKKAKAKRKTKVTRTARRKAPASAPAPEPALGA
jgi:hypothetical protein